MEILRRIAHGIDCISDWSGKAVAWLALALVLIQFAIVIMRYVFGISSIFVQESLIYLFASLFMLGAAYTLRHNGHVRVDVFYREASARYKAWIDFFGVLLALLPMCYMIWSTGWGYVAAAWAVKEGSRETSGIQAVYLLKTEILIFAVLMALQGIALALHSLLAILHREELSKEEALRL